MGFALLAAVGCAAGHGPVRPAPSAAPDPVAVVVRWAEAILATRSGPVPWRAPLPVAVPGGSRARLTIEAGTHLARGRLQAYRLRLWEEAGRTVVADAVVWVAPGSTARVLVGPADGRLVLEVHRLARLPGDALGPGPFTCPPAAPAGGAYRR